MMEETSNLSSTTWKLVIEETQTNCIITTEIKNKMKSLLQQKLPLSNHLQSRSIRIRARKMTVVFELLAPMKQI